MSNTDGIILIHGAGLRNFIWDELKQHIDLPVLEIEFPNREQSAITNKKVQFEEYVNRAIQQIQNWEVKRFTIVAHSIGGCLALKLNEHFKESVIGLIAIGAAIPKSGKSFAQCLPFPVRTILPVLLNLFGTKPPDKEIEHQLCNDLNTSQSSEIIKRFSPESVKLYTSKVYYETLPRESLYVKLTNDNALNQKIQNEMIENLNPTKVVELHSGHLPMISMPGELAKTINAFIQK